MPDEKENTMEATSPHLEESLGAKVIELESESNNLSSREDELEGEAEHLTEKEAELSSLVAHLEEKDRQQTGEMQQLQAEIEQAKEREHQLEEEKSSLEHISSLLQEFKERFDENTSPLHEEFSQLTEVYQGVEHEISSLNDAVTRVLESTQSAENELMTGLDHLEDWLTSQLTHVITENSEASQTLHTTFQDTLNHERQKLEEEVGLSQAAFSDLSKSVEEWENMGVQHQSDYQAAFQRLTQHFTGQSEQISQFQDHLGHSITALGDELTHHHLSNLQGELTQLDTFTHEQMWHELQRGFDDIKGHSIQHLETFVKDLLDTGDHIGNRTQSVLNNLAKHTESEVKRDLEDAFLDATKDGVEHLIEEVVIQLAEATAGQTIAMTLPELAVAIKAAQAALAARKVERGVKKGIMDGVHTVEGWFGL